MEFQHQLGFVKYLVHNTSTAEAFRNIKVGTAVLFEPVVPKYGGTRDMRVTPNSGTSSHTIFNREEGIDIPVKVLFQITKPDAKSLKFTEYTAEGAFHFEREQERAKADLV